MVTIEQLESLQQKAKEAILSLGDTGIIVQEDHLRDLIRDFKGLQFPVLIAVVPAARKEGRNRDSMQWNNSLLFFVLKKVTRAKELRKSDAIRETQPIMLAFETLLTQLQADYSEGCPFLQKLDQNTIQIEPEYNLADCDGWSISFSLMT